jgi:hypothetical protein
MLGIGSGSFDPETLAILETAFDEAWITLKANGSGNIRPDETRATNLPSGDRRRARSRATA